MENGAFAPRANAPFSIILLKVFKTSLKFLVKWEHSAIHLASIKLLFVIKIFVLSIFSGHLGFIVFLMKESIKCKHIFNE